MSSTRKCRHPHLLLNPSPHAASVGYRRPTGKQRSKAAGQATSNFENDGHIFPAPLILPGDELALDPKYPSQSVRSWLQEKERNRVTDARKTIYVVPPPDISPKVEFVTSWTVPSNQEATGVVTSPDVQHVTDYIAAFYHGLSVKKLPSSTCQIVAWDDDPKEIARLKAGRSKKPLLVGLKVGNELLGVYCRPAPDKTFRRQLSLNGLIDGAMSVLPEDAYALVMLVDHDLYEDEDDEFVCGRAYGGSRVAVVSSARYNPTLDASLKLDTKHAWPNSHCKDFVRTHLSDQEAFEMGKDGASRPQSPGSERSEFLPALEAASKAAAGFENTNSQVELFPGLWLGRMCRTAAHELGHCFGIDHCIYYACSMQGSASLYEDIRQPPYLCPIDLAKVLQATGVTEQQHYAAVIEFCRVHEDIEMFVSLQAWILERLRQL